MVRSSHIKSLESFPSSYGPTDFAEEPTLLKKPENLNADQNIKLKELLKCNLKTMRAYLLKESFQRLWEYVSEYWAGLFIDKWTKEGDVVKNRANEKRGTNNSSSQVLNTKLLSSEEGLFFRSCGRIEQ